MSAALTTALVLVGVVLVVALVGGWLWSTADRLDRLHHRTEVAREALATQLARRVTAVQRVAGSGVLDDAEALLLLDAADRAATEEEPGAAQSALSQALRSVFGQPHEGLSPDDLADLASACRRVELARRFHNDLVASTRLVRDLPRVRWLHLAGRAPEPRTVDLDDGVPEAF